MPLGKPPAGRRHHIDPRPANYIGRVGALAVALGIGAAVAANPGVAFAETESSSTTGHETPSGATTTGVDGQEDTPSPAERGTETGQESGPPSDEVDDADEVDQLIGDDFLSDEDSSGLEELGGGDTGEQETMPEQEVKPTDDAAHQKDGGSDLTSSTPNVTTPGVAQPEQSEAHGLPSFSVKAADALVRDESVATNAANPQARVTTLDIAASTFSGSSARHTDSTTTELADAPASTAFAPISFFTGLVSGVLSLFGLGPADPATPAEPPLLWALLAWVRRESQRVFFNDAPTIGYHPDTTSQSEDGIVTGDLGAADDEDDPLSFTVTQAPSRGTVVVHSDGTFTYTPDTTLAAQGGEDTFTVKVSDAGPHFHGLFGFLRRDAGHSTQQTITVPVAAVQPNQAPVVDPDQITRIAGDLSIGEVTGSLGVIDPDGDDLTFTVTGLPAHGSITIDAKTGTYSYIPTAASRLLAGVGEVDTDSFTVAAADLAGNTVVVEIDGIEISPQHLAVGGPVAAGDFPFGMVVVGDRLYVTNGAGNTVTVVSISADTFAFSAMAADEPDVITVGNGPTSLAVLGNRMYVTNQADGTISVVDIDPASETYHTVIGDAIPVGAGAGAIAVNGDQLYVVNPSLGEVSVVDAGTASVISTIAVGGVPFDAVAANGQIYVSRNDGTVVVIDAVPTSQTHNTIVGPPVQLAGPALGIAADEAGEFVYVAGIDAMTSNGIVSIIDTSTNTLVETAELSAIPVGLGTASDVVVSADGSTVFAVNAAGDTVSVIDTAARTVVDTFRYETSPTPGLNMLALSPDGANLFVSDPIAGTVSLLTLDTGRVVAPRAAVSMQTDAIDPSTGAVDIAVTTSGEEGAELTLTVSPASKGQVTVDDNGGGTYNVTYTPTPQARVDAFNTPGADSDSFTITVDDRRRIRTVTVTVPIDPVASVNHPPVVVGASTDVDFATGVVVGSIGFHDPDGDEVVYSVASAPDPSVGVVDLDPETGQWTFTPTDAARLASWLNNPSPGSTDTVTIEFAGSDGQNTSVVALTVPVWGSSVIDEITLGNAPVDMVISGDRIYVLNSRGGPDGTFFGDVTVIDRTTNSVIGSPIVISHPPDETHGFYWGHSPTDIALAPDGRLYVVSDYATDGIVTVIDTSGDFNAVIAEPIVVGGSAQKITLNWDGTRAYVPLRFDNESAVAVIKLNEDDYPVTKVVLPSAPYDLVVSPDGSRVYVASFDRSVRAIDTSTNTVIGDPIVFDEAPIGMLVSHDGSELYVLTPSNSFTGLTGYLTVVDTETFSVIYDPVDVGVRPEQMILSPDGDRVYISYRGAFVNGQGWLSQGLVRAVDLISYDMVPGAVAVGHDPSDMVVSADGRRLYVTSSADGTMTVVDITTTNALPLQSFAVPVHVNDLPIKVAVSGDGARLYVLNTTATAEEQGSLQVLETGTSNVDPATIAPSSYAALYERLRLKTMGTAEGVYIETVLDDEGDEARVIVYIGGTTDDIFGTNQPKIDNYPAYVHRTVKNEQIALIDAALEKAPGAKVLLVGFSQGGMDAQNIAASGRYNVTSVVTFGSPIVQPPSTEYLTIHLWDPRDNVAQLTHIKYGDYYLQAMDADQLFQFESNSVDPGWFIPVVDSGWWAVHSSLRTYTEVAEAFENSYHGSGEGYYPVKNDVQQYLGQPLLPPGYAFIDGTLIPPF